MPTKTKMTKALVLNLAREVYGARTTITEHKDAPNKEAKDAATKRIREIAQRRAEIKTEVEQEHLKNHARKLATAVRTFVDAKIGEENFATFTAMCHVLAVSERMYKLTEEYAALYIELREQQGIALSSRWSMCDNVGPILCVISRDTLEELHADLVKLAKNSPIKRVKRVKRVKRAGERA